MFQKVAFETKNTGGSREVTKSVLEWTLYAISRVTEADILRGAETGTNFDSSIGGRWPRIPMKTFWAKYVDDARPLSQLIKRVA